MALFQETTAQKEHSRLKPRHLYMIALGGALGAAFLVGTGRTLAKGGPVFTFIGFALICFIIFVFFSLINEMATAMPLNGAGLDMYTTHFLSKSFGFAMGWNYWFSYAILVPFEITVSTLVIHYWKPPVHDAVFLSILVIAVCGLNYLPIKNSGEAEFAFSSLKLLTVVGIIIVSIVIVAGGAPSGEVVGFSNWDPPVKPWIVEGSAGKFVAFLGVLVSIVLPMGLIAEMVIICGGETLDPIKSLPKAGQAFGLRLAFLYVLPVFLVTMVCPADQPELTSGGAGAGSSPFVIAIKISQIKVLDHILNGIILISAWSAGNVFCLLASRSLYSLALDGKAPKMFAITNRWGTPYLAVSAGVVLSLLAYLNVSKSAGVVLNWLVNIINMSAILSWVLLSWCYLRFRGALEAQGIDRTSLPYRGYYGKPGAYFCIVFFTIIGLLNGFQVFFPSQWDTADFVTAYIGLPLFGILLFGFKYYKARDEDWLVPLSQIDISSGAVVESLSVEAESRQTEEKLNA